MPLHSVEVSQPDKVFYHETLPENIPSIMRHGLIPKQQKDGFFWPQTLKAIFLRDDLEWVLEHSDVAEYYGEEDREAILEVHIPKGFKIYRYWNFIHEIYEYYICKRVPPFHLKVL